MQSTPPRTITWLPHKELLTRSLIAFQTSKQILLNFSHRKALVAYSFPSVIRLLVTFQKNYFLRDTLQVVLVLMIPISSFYHIRKLRKRAVRQTDRQTERFWVLLYRYYYNFIDSIWKYFYYKFNLNHMIYNQINTRVIVKYININSIIKLCDEQQLKLTQLSKFLLTIFIKD
jgi:hypothetical protein